MQQIGEVNVARENKRLVLVVRVDRRSIISRFVELVQAVRKKSRSSTASDRR